MSVPDDEPTNDLAPDLPRIAARLTLVEQRIRLQHERLNTNDNRINRIERFATAAANVAITLRTLARLVDEIAGIDRKEPT